MPQPRGAMTEFLLDALAGAPGTIGDLPMTVDDALGGDDFQLALYLCYELHYRGLPGVDDGWEWDPSLLRLRARMESSFTHALKRAVGRPATEGSIEQRLIDLVRSDPSPSLSTYLRDHGTGEHFREFMVHRSAYQLKEADPHTWAIPRLWGAPKAALIEIQSEEYGEGKAAAMHSSLFATSMRALGLDTEYGAYLDVIPGPTLATVNVMSMFGLHRRWRGAIVGHLAGFEMTSTEPNRRYAEGLRRLGFGPDALHFYEEHVEADATHEVLAAHHLAAGLADQEPEVAEDILFGAAALLALEGRFAEYLIGTWTAGETSLREPVRLSLSA
ncbi:MAG: iron-containing redox enzyme family protein [Actinomycetota bacterium]